MALGCLLLPFPLTAQVPGMVVASGESLLKEFRVKSDIDCPRSNYLFRMKVDRDFLRLPRNTVELSNRDSATVVIEINARGLEPGQYDSTVTIDCIDCGRCRTRSKYLPLTITVIESNRAEGDAPEDDPNEIVVQLDGREDEALPAPAPVPVPAPVPMEEDEQPLPTFQGASVDEALVLIERSGMVLKTKVPDIERVDLLRVTGQRPPAGTGVVAGSDVSLEFGVPVPDLVGLPLEKALVELRMRGLSGDGGMQLPAHPDRARVTAQLPGPNAVHPVGAAVSLEIDVPATGVEPRWLIWVAVTGIIFTAWLVSLWRRKIRRSRGVDFDIGLQLDPGRQKTAADPVAAGPIVGIRLNRDAGTQSMRMLDSEPARQE